MDHYLAKTLVRIESFGGKISRVPLFVFGLGKQYITKGVKETG